jgi:hypothetical protein
VIIPEALVPFWRLAQVALGPDALARLYDISFFGDNESSANHLGQLVVAGRSATGGRSIGATSEGSVSESGGARRRQCRSSVNIFQVIYKP